MSESESEKYFRRQNKAHRNKQIKKAVTRQACCGIPFVMSLLLLLLGLLATLLIALGRL
jgi:hypothetical protein